MKSYEVIEDKWEMFQCTKCFNRFGPERLKVNNEDIVVCPIDHQPVKQLLDNEGRDARAEMGWG